MRVVLFTILFLAGCVQVTTLAEAKVCVGEGADQECWPKIDNSGDTRVTLEAITDCEIKMEAAMRAMEPYRPSLFFYEVIDQAKLRIDNPELSSISLAKLVDRIKAMETQWDTAKQECWIKQW